MSETSTMLRPVETRVPARKKISFAIPVYRNERALTITHEKITGVFATELPNYDLEIVFVNDGSDDGSLAELMGLRENDPRVKVISFTRNFGQMAAILAAFKHCTGDAVINVSADLQDPVELVVKMVKEWELGNRVVICYRTDRDDTFFAKAFSRFAYGILRITFPQIPPGGFDFIFLDRRVLDDFNRIEIRNRFLQGDILWMGYKTAFLPYVRLKRTIGKSQYTFAKKLKNFLDAFLDSSYIAIRMMSLLGIVTAFLGFLYGATVVYARLMYETPFTGWAPIMIAIMLVGGVLMLMLGVIGEYVWRVYDEVRKKPNYIIAEQHLD